MLRSLLRPLPGRWQCAFGGPGWRWLRLGLVGLTVVASLASASPEPRRGGGVAPVPRFDDLAPVERRQLARAARAARRHAVRPKTDAAPYAFFPQGGEPGRDLFLYNFVDLDPELGAIRDFECSAYTYDGHGGHDALIRSFREQEVGVPVFAARDGVVVRAHDGEPDRSSMAVPGTRSNLVILDHQDGYITAYYHLRRGSVRVAVGERVTAGTELGQTASSGVSDAPHLHFETVRAEQSVEPSHGPCQPATSLWERQPPLHRALAVRDAYWSRQQPPDEWPAYLEETTPRLRAASVGEAGPYLEVTLYNLPGASNYELELRRPDGSVAFREAASFGYPELLRFSWWWWRLAVPLDVAGSWTAHLAVNGVAIGSFPLRVVEPGTEAANRAPRALRAVRLDPPAPSVERALRCIADSPLHGLDPDLDLVRYRYEWRVNGELRREVVSAAASDMLARGVARAGDAVSCRVTPGDGELDAPPTTVQSLPQPLGCVAGDATLCLLGGRYQVRGRWRNQYDGSGGPARVTRQSDLAGLLWFTSAANPEVMVKVLDFDGVIKVFYGQLTDLEVELEVTETATGTVRVYRNAPQNCGAIDQDAFPKRAGATTGRCVPSATALCLGNRLRVEASWHNHYDGSRGEATGRALPGGLAGALAFADPANVELLVKALDFGDRVLVLWGALSDLGYTLRVTDTSDGTVRIYDNPPGRYCGGLDPAAF